MSGTAQLGQVSNALDNLTISNDLNSGDRHNWLTANQKTAAALKAKGFHYKFVQGTGVGHCDGQVRSAAKMIR